MTTPLGGPPEKYTEKKVRKIFERYMNGGWRDDGRAVPSVKHFATKVGTSRRYLLQKAEKSEWLSHMIEEIKEEQRDTLINDGLQNKINPTITKLILSQHGVHEKTQQEHSGELSIREILDTLTDEPLGPAED